MMTNDLEGVRSTRKEISDILNDISRQDERGRRLKGMVKKYNRLISDGAAEKIESCEDLRRVYDELVYDEIADENRPDGRLFRNGPVSVVAPTGKEKHRGISPPEENIRSEIEHVLEIAKANSLPPLVKTALVHYFIGYIHPFYDGNGRLSRFLSSCMLKQQLSIYAALGLSKAIKDNRTTYYKGFDMANSAKNRGDTTPFILGFLELISKEEAATIEKLERSREKLGYYHGMIKRLGYSDDSATIVYVLIQNKLFGAGPLDIAQLSAASSMQESKVRYLLKQIETEHPGLSLRGRSGHKATYTANLEQIEKYAICK